jgi:hypothetical protein
MVASTGHEVIDHALAALKEKEREPSGGPKRTSLSF